MEHSERSDKKEESLIDFLDNIVCNDLTKFQKHNEIQCIASPINLESDVSVLNLMIGGLTEDEINLPKIWLELNKANSKKYHSI